MAEKQDFSFYTIMNVPAGNYVRAAVRHYSSKSRFYFIKTESFQGSAEHMPGMGLEEMCLLLEQKGWKKCVLSERLKGEEQTTRYHIVALVPAEKKKSSIKYRMIMDKS